MTRQLVAPTVVSNVKVPEGQFVQLVSSFSASGPYLPAGQASQAVAEANGANMGFAMNEPEEQHPKRPVHITPLALRTIHALLLPHSVRVKPLSSKT